MTLLVAICERVVQKTNLENLFCSCSGKAQLRPLFGNLKDLNPKWCCVEPCLPLVSFCKQVGLIWNSLSCSFAGVA